MKSDRNLVVPEPTETDLDTLAIESGLKEAQVRGWFDQLDQRISDLFDGVIEPQTQLDCVVLNRHILSALDWSSDIPLVPQGVRIHKVMRPLFYATSIYDEDDSSTDNSSNSLSASPTTTTTTSSSSSNDATGASVFISCNDESSDDASSLDSIEVWNQHVAAGVLAEVKGKKEHVFNTVATPEKSSVSLDTPETLLAENVLGGAHSFSFLLEEMLERQGDIAFSADSLPVLSPLPIDGGSNVEEGEE